MIYEKSDVAPNQQKVTQGDIHLNDIGKKLAHFNVVASKPFDVFQVESSADIGDGVEVLDDDVRITNRREYGGGFSNSKLVKGSGTASKSKNTNTKPKTDEDAVIELDSTPAEQWDCSACTYKNNPDLSFCDMCHNDRPAPNKRSREEEEEDSRPAKKQKKEKSVDEGEPTTLSL